ncbi:MAG: GerMN domain-containing protein [Acidimicrobiia bacterium]|nr:GerMN domain-containing protein [Acidimicrobiia bacterium]
MKRLVILVLGITACSGGSSATTAALPQDTTGTSTTTASSAPTVTVPPDVATTTTAPRFELSEPQIVYFLAGTPVGGPALVPVWRDATSPQGPRGAIETLLRGPTPAERLGVPAISSQIPAETVLLDAAIVNGLATVDFTAPFYDDNDLTRRLAQVTYTLTRFPEVESVAYRQDGEPYAGVPGAVSRLTFREMQPPILVEQPAYGGPAAQPGRLVGEARIAADRFGVHMTDADGLTIAEFDVLSEGAGWVPFDIELPYFVEVDQSGELTISTPDGVVDQTYPLQLLLPTPGVCSAAGLSSTPVDQGLPSEVDAKRRAIIEAATSCDLDALSALAASDFTFSFGGGTDPARFWTEQEATGLPVTRLMVQLLNTPPVLDTEFFEPTYLWPSAFRAAPLPEDFDLLIGILPPEDIALYRQFNEYLDLRLGISESGSWDFAVAGD